MYEKSLGMRHLRVLRARTRQSWPPSSAAGAARDGKDEENAPTEPVGCTIDARQDSKTEIPVESSRSPCWRCAMKRIWQQWLAVVGALAAYALATLPVLLRYPPVWPDEVIFSTPAISLARHGFLSSDVLTGFLAGMDRYYYWHPPLYFLVLAPFMRVVPPHDYLLVMRLASWCLGAAFLVLSGFILRRISGSLWAMWGTLVLLATHITFIRAANIGRMEMLTLVCGAASVVAYFRALETEGRRWWAVAGLAGGLACVSHPAGAFIVAGLVLHYLTTLDRHSLRESKGLVFLAWAAAPLLAWLVYAVRAPSIFASQLGGQYVRKAAEMTGTLAPGILAKILYPVKFSPMPGLNHDWFFLVIALVVAGMCLTRDQFFLVIALVVAGMCLTQTEGQRWFRIVGFWAISGVALNLLAHEDWYPVYFSLPVILLLGGCAAAARHPLARRLAAAMILAGILGNFLLISMLHGNKYLTWKEYREYASAIAAKIPPGSSVLLAAIPDPYFGMLAEGRGYHFHEFVPIGVPVDADLAERTLDSTDYVVDTGCCRPAYLDRYMRAHGTLVSDFQIAGHAWPDVRVWRLRRP